MLFLIALAIALCIAFLLGDQLKKHPFVFYIAAAAVTIAVIVISQMQTNRTITIENTFVRNYLIGIFSKGAFAGALWCIVMWAGALPNGSAPIKKLMPIRGELSILTAVVTMAHAVTYSITYFKRYTTFREHDISLTTDFIITVLICFVLMLIMIPLTVMSFKAVRKKMNGKTWKKIQRCAYVFYALILVHILVLYIPQARKGSGDRWFSVIVYSIVFIGYAVMRLRKLYIQKKKPESKAALNAVCAVAGIIFVGVIALLSHGKAPEPISAQPVQQTEQSAVTTSVAEESEEIVTTAVTGTDDSASTVTGTGSETTASGESTDTADTETTVTGTDTSSTSDAELGSEETETTAAEEQQSEEPSEDIPQDEPQQEEPREQQQEQPAQNEPEPEPEPQYVYNNGTFRGVGASPADDEGKDIPGQIQVDVTIENDVITNVTVVDWGIDDADFYVIAQAAIPGQYSGMDVSGGVGSVDAYCGATRSAEGIIEAVGNALNSARK